jgi:hypothetical protein
MFRTAYIFAFALILTSCGNVWENESYHLTESPADPSNLTLYFTFADGGGGHGRIENIKKLSYSAPFFFAIDKSGKYWFFNAEMDSEPLNANEIVS